MRRRASGGPRETTQSVHLRKLRPALPSQAVGPVEPYCSLRCKDEAKAVRYARAKLAGYETCNMADLPQDVQDAVRMKIAHALAGGYDEQARRLTPALRKAIFDDESRCVLCGAPGTEIDHIDGPSANPENLRVICRDCHKAVTEERFVPIEDGSRQAKKSSELWLRIGAPRPIRPCDADGWSSIWRAWARNTVSRALSACATFSRPTRPWRSLEQHRAPSPR